MTLLRSAAQRPVPKSVLFGSIAFAWGAPCVLGWILAALLIAGKGLVPAEIQLPLYGLVYLLVFSPLFSWVGWLLALPLVWLLLRDGWFGWLSAGLVGLVAGAVAGGLIGSPVALPFGGMAVLALRAILGSRLALRPL
ncbi:hypothetical protein [Pseudorhodobacter wandonensis]|uniref:hypothetical protein n=1 Tax=Pseudorhodobacter wandonensis TaxID=1120568 RepID=UPI00067B1DA8|nr:hypothetical protein [Pseudorhodobacter wandonensis]